MFCWLVQKLLGLGGLLIPYPPTFFAGQCMQIASKSLIEWYTVLRTTPGNLLQMVLHCKFKCRFTVTDSIEGIDRTAYCAYYGMYTTEDSMTS